MRDELAVYRQYGAAKAGLEMALEYLKGRSLVSKDILIEALARILEHDGSDEFHLFAPDPEQMEKIL